MAKTVKPALKEFEFEIIVTYTVAKTVTVLADTASDADEAINGVIDAGGEGLKDITVAVPEDWELNESLDYEAIF